MTRTIIHAEEAFDRLKIAAQQLTRPVQLMEVCGTHTVSAFRSGLHSLIPSNVTLLSGPGCPVCVTAQGDIDQIIHLASLPDVTLCTYGDMIRVTGSNRQSLQDARSRGADVRVVYSSLDAIRLAQAEPKRQVVFAAVGFETTAPATAAAVIEAELLGLTNFSALTSHKLVMPALRGLLDSRQVNIDALVCPGHVAIIIGADAFRPVVDEYGLPCVITGFEGNQIAAAMARLTEMIVEGIPLLENLYPQAVTEFGNFAAQIILDKVFEPADAWWRGLGELKSSGLVLRQQYAQFDARNRFDLPAPHNEEPKGCRCGDVITGRATPAECVLFNNGCSPIHPIGPCMVSSEGTCQAWFKYRRGNSNLRREQSAVDQIRKNANNERDNS